MITENKPNVIVAFECACDIHWMKDVVQFPLAISKNLLGNAPLLIARPNHKQKELQKHIKIINLDKEIKSNFEQYEKLIFSKFVTSPQWYQRACKKASSLGSVLILYPWYGDPYKGARSYKFLRWLQFKKATVILKTDGDLSLKSLYKVGIKEKISDFFSFLFIDFIVCENQYYFSKLKLNHPHLFSKLIYIPNCPLEMYNTQKPISFSEREQYFLFVGRGDDPQKGLDILIEIWKKKHEHLLNWKLLIVGTCSIELKEKWIDELKQLNIDESVMWLGTYNPEYLRQTYNKVKIVICPSREDSGPIILSEAVLSGCAFIGSAVGEIPHVLEGLPGLAKTNEELEAAIILFAHTPAIAEDQAKTLYKRMKDRSWLQQTKQIAKRVKL